MARTGRDERLARAGKCLASGVTVRDWCAANSVTDAALCVWVRRLWEGRLGLCRSGISGIETARRATIMPIQKRYRKEARSMCVAFGARDVYEFILSQDSDARRVLEVKKSSVRTFCMVLEQEITAHSDASPFYDCVHFALDSQSVASFFESNRDRFLDFGSSVLYVSDDGTDAACIIEQEYDNAIVTHALREARRRVLAEVGA